VKGKRTRRKKGESTRNQTPPATTDLKPVGQVVVTYKQALEKLPEDKHIHPRRPMRLVPDKAPKGNKPIKTSRRVPKVNQSDFMSQKERKKGN